MAKLKVKNKLMDPRLFSRDRVLDEIRYGNQNIWLKPDWPTRSVLFTDTLRYDWRDMIKALTDENNATSDQIQLGYEIFMCSMDHPCGSPLCNYCRLRHQKRYTKRVLETFNATPEKNIYFLTVLDDITYSPEIDAPLRKDYLKQKIKTTLKSDPATEHIRMMGMFELDLKSASTYINKPKQEKLLKDHYSLFKNSHVGWMPHFHALIDIGDTHLDVVKDILRDVFDKPYQIDARPMYTDPTKEENLTDLAHYMLKFKIRYAENIMCEKAQYKRRFGPGIMRRYASVLNAMGCRRGARSFEILFNL